MPDFTRQARSCVIGGGNVVDGCDPHALFVSARVSVTCVYRRRVTDMTALARGDRGRAVAEGCQILLAAGARCASRRTRTGHALRALWTQPQIIGALWQGRPSAAGRCRSAAAPHRRAMSLSYAIGQGIDAHSRSSRPVCRSSAARFMAEARCQFVPNTHARIRRRRLPLPVRRPSSAR